MLVGKNIVKDIYRKRGSWSRKGDFGRLLVIGGSRLYSGSPAFNAIAALRAGCDLVTIAAPEGVASVIRSFSPDMIVYPLKGELLSKKHVKEIKQLMEKHTAMVIGGGLTRDKKVLEAVSVILRESRLPTVVDADALYTVRKKLAKRFLLTPHSHEFCVLSNERPTNFAADRINSTKKLAANLNCTVLLKGHIDVISDGNRAAENATGNPYMTKGGFGDTLAGICGALLARGTDAFEAACAAAYINGLAGDLAVKMFHEGTMASDLLWCIPKSIELARK